jgi:hypothetical protein
MGNTVNKPATFAAAPLPSPLTPEGLQRQTSLARANGELAYRNTQQTLRSEYTNGFATNREQLKQAIESAAKRAADDGVNYITKEDVKAVLGDKADHVFNGALDGNEHGVPPVEFCPQVNWSADREGYQQCITGETTQAYLQRSLNAFPVTLTQRVRNQQTASESPNERVVLHMSWPLASRDMAR